jgi:hypothetical protein
VVYALVVVADRNMADGENAVSRCFLLLDHTARFQDAECSTPFSKIYRRVRKLGYVRRVRAVR